MGEPKLRLQGVSQVYEGARGETRALQNMDIDVAPGEAVAILGPSGCGKSTSLLIAAGLRTPTQRAPLRAMPICCSWTSLFLHSMRFCAKKCRIC